jgi:multiple sugar transport system substrate-binding protein
VKPIRSDWEKELRHFPLNPKGVPAKLKKSVEERIAMGVRPKRNGARTWTTAAALMIAAAALFAWREPLLGLFHRQADTELFDTKTERSVKVQWMDGFSFMSRYGQAFIIRYPNMDVETISSPPYDPQQNMTAAYEAMIERDKPDVVYLPANVFKNLAAEGKLLSLEPFIAKDKYDLSAFVPGIVDGIRELGGGTLYGLTPDYMSEALFYNKDLFDRYGVPYPTDRMSWDDLLRLAQRFPASGEDGSRVYGLAPFLASPSGVAESAALAAGLSLLDANGDWAGDTDGWRTIWKNVFDGYRGGWLYEEKSSSGPVSGVNYYKRNPFLTGEAAMSLYHFTMANDLVEAKKRYGLADFRWDLVTEPVNPNKPDMSPTATLNTIFAIPVRSANAKDAWEMIKHVHSEEMAAKLAVQYPGAQGTRKRIPKALEGYRTDAFYMLKPDPELSVRAYSVARNHLNAQLNSIVDDELKAAIDGVKSFDAAVESIRQRGRQAVEQAKAEERSALGKEAAALR